MYHPYCVCFVIPRAWNVHTALTIDSIKYGGICVQDDAQNSSGLYFCTIHIWCSGLNRYQQVNIFVYHCESGILDKSPVDIRVAMRQWHYCRKIGSTL